MLVRKLWINYIIDIEVYVVGYLYIMDPIKSWKMEHIKSSNDQSDSIKCGEFLDLLTTG
jgi:hypothetical protein